MTRPSATPDDLENEDPEVRLRGLSALVETPEMRTLLKRLFQVARSDSDDRVKYAAMELYSKVRDLMDGSRVMGASLETADGKLDEHLVWRLLEHGRPDAKIDTLRVLAGRHLVAAAPLLRRRINDEDDPWVLATMVKALATLGGPEDVDCLRPRLGHGDPRVRSNTAEALGMLGTPAALAAVRPHLASSDPRMRGVAAFVLVEEDPGEALDTLQAMALANEDGAREAALYRLGKIRHGAARVILARMASRESDANRRERILELLEQRRAVGALTWLREETDEAEEDEAEEERRGALQGRIDRVATDLGLDPDGVAQATTRFRKDSEASGLAEIEDVELEVEDETDVLTRSAVFWGREGGDLGEIARQARENALARKQAQADAIRSEERRRFRAQAAVAIACSLAIGMFLGPSAPPPPPVRREAVRLRKTVGAPTISPEKAQADLERAVLQARVRSTTEFNFEDRWQALRGWLSSRKGTTPPPITTRQLYDLRLRHQRGDKAAAAELHRWIETVGDAVLATAKDSPPSAPPPASPSRGAPKPAG